VGVAATRTAPADCDEGERLTELSPSRTASDEVPIARSAPVAAVLAWLLPGLGHWWIGERHRAVILFATTSATFWAGIAVGGVRSTVTPKDNGLWIAAQLCMGPQALAALYWGKTLLPKHQGDPDPYKASWPSSDIGVVYAGVAGLLNLLVILDALARVEAGQIVVAARAPPRRRRH